MEKNQQNIPKILYKYRPINELAERMLTQGEIYFATTNELEDPLEKSFRCTEGEWITNEKNELVLLSPEENTQRYINVIRAGEKEHIGILSLCESNQEARMYEEYANNHMGICVGFDWDMFGLFFAGSYPPVRNIPRRVIYQKPLEFEKNPNPNQWLEIFITKSPEYSYEKECRIFYTKGKLSTNIIRNAIREIIFGYKVSLEQIQQVKNWVKDINHLNFYTVKAESTTSLVPRLMQLPLAVLEN